MDRIEWIEIEGKNYPLCCSLGAMEKITEINAKNGPDGAIRTNIETLAALMDFGVKRARRLDGSKVPDALSPEEIEECIFYGDYERICKAISEAIRKGQEHEIEGKPKGKKAGA